MPRPLQGPRLWADFRGPLEQEFTQRIVEAYNTLGQQFVDEGFNTGSIASAATSFDISPEGNAVPLPYTSFAPIPYPASAVRLLIAPLDHLSPNQLSSVRDLLGRIKAAVPEGASSLLVPREGSRRICWLRRLWAP